MKEMRYIEDPTTKESLAEDLGLEACKSLREFKVSIVYKTLAFAPIDTLAGNKPLETPSTKEDNTRTEKYCESFIIYIFINYLLKVSQVFLDLLSIKILIF